MLKIVIDERPVVPVRLIPLATNWRFSPDVIAKFLANGSENDGARIAPYRLDTEGASQRLLAKTGQEIQIVRSQPNPEEGGELRATPVEDLAGDENAAIVPPKDRGAYHHTIAKSNNERNRVRRRASIEILPAATFVYLDELEAVYREYCSEERSAKQEEGPADRSLNLSPVIHSNVADLIYEGFEGLLMARDFPAECSEDRRISFEALHYHLMADPYYGVESTVPELMVDAIYRDNVGDDAFRQLRDDFRCRPFKTDAQRHLVYLWCALMGLQAYQGDSRLNWNLRDFLRRWTVDFELRTIDIRDFLRKNTWPLPSRLFPCEPDNTEMKLALGDARFEALRHAFVEVLPQLHRRRNELQRIQPESIEAEERKTIAIEEVERRIAAIESGGNATGNETPRERKERLHAWVEEETRLRGKRGAKVRTAMREGISRQTLSSILMRPTT